MNYILKKNLKLIKFSIVIFLFGSVASVEKYKNL